MTSPSSPGYFGRKHVQAIAGLVLLFVVAVLFPTIRTSDDSALPDSVGQDAKVYVPALPCVDPRMPESHRRRAETELLRRLSVADSSFHSEVLRRLAVVAGKDSAPILTGCLRDASATDGLLIARALVASAARMDDPNDAIGAVADWSASFTRHDTQSANTLTRAAYVIAGKPSQENLSIREDLARTLKRVAQRQPTLRTQTTPGLRRLEQAQTVALERPVPKEPEKPRFPVEMPDSVREAFKQIRKDYGKGGLAAMMRKRKEDRAKLAAKFQSEGPQVAARGMDPVLGNTVHIPVLLGEYSDATQRFNRQAFEDLLLGSNPTGNMADYFREISLGQFELTGDVYAWSTLTQNQAYYASVNNGLNGGGARFVRDLVEALDGSINFAQYDADGDGYVDVVNVVHTGGGAETGDDDNIWSHRWSLNGANNRHPTVVGPEFVTNDPRPGHPGEFMIVNDYVIQPEQFGTGLPTDPQNRIGVFCHEFGHALGLPDLYDTEPANGDSEGVGNWCLMAGGGYGGDGAHAETPTHMSAWCKYQMGWISPTVVTTPLLGEPIEQVETTGDVYRIDIPDDPNQYFLIENRQQVGFDQYLYAPGLLIYHVDDGEISNKDEDRKLVDVEAADGDTDLDDNVNRGDTGDVFPGATSNRAFNDTSNPNSKSYAGASTGVAVENISDPATIMTADLYGQTGTGGIGIELVKDVAKSGDTSHAHGFYYFDVPDGATSVTVQTSGGPGDDLDLYITLPSTGRHYSDPYVSWDAVGGTATNDEYVELTGATNPAVESGRYYIKVLRFGAGGTYDVTASYAGGPATPGSVLSVTGPASVNRHDLAEMQVQFSGNWDGVHHLPQLNREDLFDAYDGDGDHHWLRLEAQITRQSDGHVDTVPGFLNYDPDTDAKQWLIRYAPSGTGTHDVRVLVDLSAGNGPENAFRYPIRTTPDFSFDCVAGSNTGPLQRATGGERPAYFYREDAGGQRNPFLGVGYCRAWVSDRTPDTPAGQSWPGQPSSASAQEDHRNNNILEPLKDAGGNLMLHWLAPWETMLTHHEKPGALSASDWSSHAYYDQARAARLDRLVQNAESRDIVLMFTIWPHPALRDASHVWSYPRWDDSHNLSEEFTSGPPPVSERNGFSGLGTVQEFFTANAAGSATERQMWLYQKNLYRYILARWGYSRSIGVWEIVSEIRGTEGWDNGNSDAVGNAWHDKVLNFVRDLDWSEHPVASSTHDGSAWNGGSVGGDFVSTHTYLPNTWWGVETGQSSSPGVDDTQATWNAIVNKIAQFSSDAGALAANTPQIVGEFGLQELGRDPGSLDYYEHKKYNPTLVHYALWPGLMMGHAFLPMEWNDGTRFGEMNTGQYNSLTQLTNVKTFAANMDHDAEMTAVTLGASAFSNANFRGYGRRQNDKLVAYYWIQDTAAQSGSLKGGATFAARTGVTVDLGGFTAGRRYCVEWWNTWKGTALADPTSYDADGTGTLNNVVLPNFAANDDDQQINRDVACIVTGAGPEVSTTDSPDPVDTGSNLTYTITVAQNGPTDATNIVLTDTLPSGVTYVSGSAGCSHDSGVVTCNIGTLTPGSNTQVTITVQVDPQATGTLTNTATVTSDGFPDATDEESTDITPVPVISIEWGGADSGTSPLSWDPALGGFGTSETASFTVKSTGNVSIDLGVTATAGGGQAWSLNGVAGHDEAVLQAMWDDAAGWSSLHGGASTDTINETAPDEERSFDLRLTAPTSSGELTGDFTVTITATSGATGGSETLTIAVSARVRTVDRYEITATSPQTAGAGWTETVRAVDIGGAPVSVSHSITLSATGSAAFYSDATYATPVTTMNLAGSQATLYIKDTTAETIQLSAIDGEGKTGTSADIAVNAGPANRLQIATQPVGGDAGQVLATQPIVDVMDAYGNRSTSTASITASLAQNPTAATLTGTKSVAAINGRASFTDLAISTAGQGYSLQFQSAGIASAESNTFDVADPGSGGGDGPPGEPLIVLAAMIKVSFLTPGRDMIKIMGTLPVPQGFNPDGKVVIVDAGGVQETFTLDLKGKARVGRSKFMLRAKKKKKVVQAQDAKFICLLKSGTFADTLADSGLLNETVKNKEIEVVVSVAFNDVTYATGDTTAGYRPLNMLYTAKEDKKGKAKKPK